MAMIVNPKKDILWKKVFLALDLQLYQKRDSNTGFFMWILQNFWEYLFYRTPLDDCLYLLKVTTTHSLL